MTRMGVEPTTCGSIEREAAEIGMLLAERDAIERQLDERLETLARLLSTP